MTSAKWPSRLGRPVGLGDYEERVLAKLGTLYMSEGMELPSEQARGSEFAMGVSRVPNEGNPTTLNVFSRRLRIELAAPEHRAGRELYEIPICVTGSWVKNDREFSITADDLRVMVRNFEKRKNDQVVIDYEHASEQPEIAKGGPIPAAGWIHELRANGSLYALVEWTPDALAMIRRGQYRFFSPAIDWNYRDKETGEPQGATLTSGALTNHPFLEELPAITLSDRELTETATGGLDGPLLPSSIVRGQGGAKDHGPRATDGFSGGKMSKKLSFAHSGKGKFAVKCEGLDEMFDDVLLDDLFTAMGDDFDNFMQAKGYAKGQAGIHGHQEPDDEEKLSELLRESGFVEAPPVGDEGGQGSTSLPSTSLGNTERSRTVTAPSLSRDEGGPYEQIRKALRLAATHRLVEQREAARRLLLAECLTASGSSRHSGGEGSGVRAFFDTDRAKQLLRDNKINAADLLDALEAKGMLDDAVAKGKVLPKDRAFFFEIAFNNPQKFFEYVSGAVPVVMFGTLGFGSAEPVPVDQEVDREVKRLMSERSLGYSKAMKLLFKENRQLEERYRAAHRPEIGSGDQGTGNRDGGAAGITQ